jgi:NADPH-dependent 2,4-dienoyl-CoA reductase/sulfur reductase-like enzyme
MDRIAVVGASLAGVNAAATLRVEGFDGALVVFGDEPHAPYDRPPLSKQLLAGEWDLDRIGLQFDRAALDVELRTGVRAAALDARRRALTLDGGTEEIFDGIVLATGATPRRLPGPQPAGVHVLRTVDDALALRAELDAGPDRVAVIGAGFIGAEVAATCRQRGLQVSLIEALPWPLGRVLGEDVGRLLADLHRAHGVDVRLGVGVDRLDVDDAGRVRAVVLADGTAIEASVVVVGIGVQPATGWLEGSGLVLDDGVVCDETLLAAPGITAAGDLARWPHRGFDEVLRVEHWDHAIDSGRAAARRLLCSDQEAVPYVPVPWFWSDQYDRKIQLAGRAAPHDEAALLGGSFAEGRVAVAYRRGDRVIGVLGVNRPRQVVQGRMLIERGASWEEALALRDRA